MHFLILLKVIFLNFKRNSLRSVLAIIGVTWGTIAVILLQALGTGFYAKSRQNISSISNNAISLYPGKTSKPYRGFPLNRALNIKARDIIQAQHALPSIRYASPVLISPAPQVVAYAAKSDTTMTYGTSPSFLKIKTLAAKPGRFFNAIDVRNHAFVTLIGYQLKQSLFGDTAAVGQQLLVNHVPFRIVGVLDKNTGGFAAFEYKDRVFIPYTTFIDLQGNLNISFAAFLPILSVSTNTFSNTLQTYFANRFNFSPNDKNAIILPNLKQATSFFNSFFLSIRLFLLFAGSMTLAVGCIGVTNIMYLIAHEKTFEIGLKMALGAQDKHIMLQFLLEALIIVFIGGLLGYCISLISLWIIGLLPLPSWIGKPHLSGSTTAITILILCGAALLAGWFPAKKAATMHPVDALRES